MNKEAEARLNIDFCDVVAVLEVQPDGQERICMTPMGSMMIGPSSLLGPIAAQCARVFVETGRHIRIVKFSARSTVEELKPSPEQAAEFAKRRAKEAADDAAFGVLLGQIGEEFKHRAASAVSKDGAS